MFVSIHGGLMQDRISSLLMALAHAYGVIHLTQSKEKNHGQESRYRSTQITRMDKLLYST
jgi:hypothetical protein